MTESTARDAIAHYAALLWRRGLVAGTGGNVSVRIDDGSIVVTPAGRSLRALDAAELAHVSPDGTPRPGSPRPTSELPLHLAAYRVRPEIACVVHTHPTHCIAWSNTGALFPLDTVGAIESLGSIARVPYFPAGSQALAAACSDAFAASVESVVMERHGLSSVGRSLEEAFARTDLAEQTARIELLARLLVRS